MGHQDPIEDASFATASSADEQEPNERAYQGHQGFSFFHLPPPRCVLRRELCSITCVLPSGLHRQGHERDRSFLVDVQLRGLAQLPSDLARPGQYVLGVEQLNGGSRIDAALY